MLAAAATQIILPFALVWLAVNFLARGEVSPDPSVTFAVTPGATGEQLVRTSLPLPRGFLSADQTLTVRAGRRPGPQGPEPAGLRVLSWHPALRD
jgi:hypothetical protein